MYLRTYLHLGVFMGLFFSPFISQGQDFQITLAVDEGWRCPDTEEVWFTLTAVDQTYPMEIKWDGGAQIDTAYNNADYQEYRYYSLTPSYSYEHLSVTVQVTDGTGSVRNANSYSGVIDPPGTNNFSFMHYPYAPGDTIYGEIEVSSIWSIDLEAWPSNTVWSTLNCAGQSTFPPGNCWGTWKTLAPPGTVLSASGTNGCNSGYFELTLTPPTVLPSIVIMDVQGSCANAATGNITVAAAATVPGPWSPSTGTVRVRRVSDNSVVFSAGVSLAPGTMATTGPLEPGSYWVNLVSNQFAGPDTILVEVPSLGGTCGTLRGRAYVDINENCTYQAGSEPNLRQAILEILPGPIYLTTNSSTSWNYSRILPVGAYTMTLGHPQLEEHCTGGPIPFNITDTPTPLTVDLPTRSSVPLDMALLLSSGAARPGFEYRVSARARNLTPANSGASTAITVTYDPLLTFLEATPPPTSTSDNTLTWVLGNVTAWGESVARMRFEVPPDVGLLGTELVTTAELVTGNTDGDLSNNTATTQRIITGAYDPNDKLAWTSSGSDTWWLPGEDQWIDYTIRFQNTGTDTAFNVLISDTLPAALDPASLMVGASSHTFQWMVKDAGVLNFAFPGILLPDSNVNESASHGFVSFRIKVRDGFMTEPGEEVVNIAGIYFDFNPPIITEPCVLTVPYPEEQVLLDAQVHLSGVYDTGSGLMRDDLRALGLLPTSEPYSALGYSFQGGGGETVSPAVLAQSGPTAIVDWVVVELRSAADASAVGYSRAALLRRDGRLVDLDGTSPVAITAPSSSYLVGLQHRNHLPVLFDQGLFFQPAESEDATAVDFTDPAAPVFGVEAQRPIGSVMALWPGDVDFNGTVKYTGANNDRDAVLLRVGGATPTNVVSGYFTEDVNLDGEVRYTGADNDRDIILQTIGGSVPTAVRNEQLP